MTLPPWRARRQCPGQRQRFYAPGRPGVLARSVAEHSAISAITFIQVYRDRFFRNSDSGAIAKLCRSEAKGARPPGITDLCFTSLLSRRLKDGQLRDRSIEAARCWENSPIGKTYARRRRLH